MGCGDEGTGMAADEARAVTFCILVVFIMIACGMYHACNGPEEPTEERITMTNLDDLRLKILDRAQVVLDERIGTGDGATSEFRTRHYPVMGGSCVTSVAGEPTVECFLEVMTGKIKFNDPVPDGLPITATYDFAGFTDDELQKFIDDAGGNIATAAGNALDALIKDRDRLVTWSRGSTKVDYDQLRKDLHYVSKRFLAQGQQETAGTHNAGVDWEEVV